MSSIEDRLYGSPPAAPVAPPPPPPAAPIPAPVVAAAPVALPAPPPAVAAATPPVETTPAVDAPPADEPAGEFALIPLPDAIAEIRNTPERRLFGADTRPEITALLEDSEGMPESPEHRAALAGELSAITVDLGLSKDDIATFASVSRELRTANLDVESVRTLQGDAIDALNAAYGQDATKAHQAAVALVARDPRVATWLEKTGAGNHPRTVLALAKIAMERRHS